MLFDIPEINFKRGACLIPRLIKYGRIGGTYRQTLDKQTASQSDRQTQLYATEDHSLADPRGRNRRPLPPPYQRVPILAFQHLQIFRNIGTSRVSVPSLSRLAPYPTGKSWSRHCHLSKMMVISPCACICTSCAVFCWFILFKKLWNDCSIHMISTVCVTECKFNVNVCLVSIVDCKWNSARLE